MCQSNLMEKRSNPSTRFYEGFLAPERLLAPWLPGRHMVCVEKDNFFQVIFGTVGMGNWGPRGRVACPGSLGGHSERPTQPLLAQPAGQGRPCSALCP